MARVLIRNLLFDRVPRDHIIRIAAMSFQSSIKFSCLLRRQGRFVSLLDNALPQRIDQLDLFRQWQLASVRHELRTHVGECNNKNHQKQAEFFGNGLSCGFVYALL